MAPKLQAPVHPPGAVPNVPHPHTTRHRSSNARTNVQRKRKTAVAEKVLKPGIEPKDFIQVHKLEGQVGAYLLFNRRESLRRFAMSSRSLIPYMHAYADRNVQKDGKEQTIQVRQRDVLEYIRDQRPELETDEDPATVYPVQNDGLHALQRTALACAQMLRAVERTAAGELKFNQNDEDKARAAFARFTGRVIPSFDAATLEVRSFGPFPDYGEGELEPYNRCLTLIMYVNWVLSPKVWEVRFGNSSWDMETLLSTDQVPHWMRAQDSGTMQTRPAPDYNDGSSPEERRPSINVRIEVDMKSTIPEQVEFMKRMREGGKSGLLVRKAEIVIRPAASVSEVRDTIRWRCNLKDVKAQIHTLQLMPSWTDVMGEEWTVVQDELWAEDVEKPVLMMTLRSAQDGEIILENEEVPGLSKHILIIDGDDVRQKDMQQEVVKDDDGSRSGLVDTIHSSAGTSVDTLRVMVEKYFKSRKDDLLKFFTVGNVSYDVETPGGLLEYQKKVFDELSRREVPSIVRDDNTTTFGKKHLTQTQLDKFNDAKADGQFATMSLPDVGSQARYYALNAIHTGTQEQVGLPIIPCATALQMNPYETPSGRLLYRSDLPGLNKTSFYAYQVSGCATILIALFGRIPLPENAPEQARTAAKELEGLAIGAKFLCDQTGMGKSKVFLLTVYYAQFHIDRNDEGKPEYRYNTLAVPSGVIKQWADAILEEFPELHLVISYDDTGLSEAKYVKHFVKATAFKKFSHPGLWPERHRYLLDNTDKRNAVTIVLTSHDTLVKRSLVAVKKLVKPGKRYDPDTVPMEDFDPHEKNADGTLKHWEVRPIEETVYYGNQAGRVRIAGADEAHRLKNNETMRWKAFSSLEAQYTVIIGATPMANVCVDAIAQIELIWPAAQRALDNATQEDQDWVTERKGSMAMYYDGEKELNNPLDPRRLGYLHPATVRVLLEKGTVVDHARYFKLTANLLCLNRSMSSKIPYNFDGEEVYECKGIMKPVSMVTRTTKFLPEEAAEQQIQHRDASLRFLQACRAASNTKGKGSKDKAIYPVAEMRELMITTASTKLRVFNQICNAIGKDTLVDSMATFRDGGFDGWAFVSFICMHSGEAPPSTAFGYLRYMYEGSPLLRALIMHICKDGKFLKPRKHGKLFVLDDTPLVAMFLHWALNMMGINTTLFHSGLTNDERNKLQDDFNDPQSDTDCMISLYDIGGLGRNFHRDCANGVLTSSGKNQAAETQGAGRLVRAPQEKEVTITKIFVENTIMAYREFRKRDKVVVELATRSGDPEIQMLLVDVLNERQEAIRAAQNDPENEVLVKKLKERALVMSQQTKLLAVAAPDRNDLGASKPVDGKRIPKPIIRYSDADYDENGRFIEPHGSFRPDDDNQPESDSESFDPDDPYSDDDSNDGLGNVEDGDQDYDPLEEEQEVFDDEGDDALFSDMDEAPENESKTAKEKRKALRAARAQMRNENQEYEAMRRLKLLLTADPSKVYDAKDLEKADTLKLALELVHCARTGTEYDRPTSIHIAYGNIHDKLKKAVDTRIDVTKDVRAKLSDALDRGKKTAPDQLQQEVGRDTSTTTRNTATDCASISDCKREHGTVYAKWPVHYLREELESRTKGPPLVGDDVEEMIKGLERGDWEREFMDRN